MEKRMKTFMLMMILSAAVICSCTKVNEPDEQDKEKRETNIWIEQQMRQYYLWEDEIPAAKKLDYFADEENFFHSLLSNKDGKGSGNEHYFYSYINKKTNTKAYQGEEPSFGFEFQYYNITSNGATIYHAVLVLYVLPESSASEKGLKRGDWILKINRNDIPDNAADLLKALSTGTETVFGLTAELSKTPSVYREVSLTPGMIIDNPVFVDTTYVYGREQHRIGYLTFNHFTSGIDGNEEMFHDSMRKAFAKFKNNQVQDFILDLRYNTGGLVKTAQLLTTMLAPASALNDIFCKYTYNKKLQLHNESQKMDATYMTNGATAGANLDLKRIFIITSSRTASASEAVINCLEPYMKGQIILIGGKTEGKNVASSTFSHDKSGWEMHPIISYISNKDDFSDYASGFQPTYPCTEIQQTVLYNLGDLNEFMLRQTVDFIVSGKPIQDGTTRSLRSTSGLELIPVYSSIERRATNGVMIDNFTGL